MAIKQHTQFDKYRRYAIKYFDTKLKGLAPNAVAGRFTAPRILLVSVPKSGTHMLESILEEFPGLRNSGWRTLTNETCSDQSIRRIGRGMFANSHLYYTPELARLIREQGIKTIFVMRDPRDIVVSRYKYIREIDHLHPAHQFLASFDNDRDGLMAAIAGKDNIMPGMQTVLEGFRGWLHDDAVLSIKYEDLVGSTGMGSDAARAQTLSDIASHLESPITQDSLDRLDHALRSKNSSTRRKGVIGGWKEEFSEEHTAFFKQHLQQLLNEYGYNN